MTSRPRIASGVSRIPVAEIILDGAEVRALVCKCEAAGVAQHVWVNSLQARTFADRCNHVAHGAAHHLTIALGNEQPGQLVLAASKVTLQGSQLIAVQRMLC
jgi:hypothetical protein